MVAALMNLVTTFTYHYYFILRYCTANEYSEMNFLYNYLLYTWSGGTMYFITNQQHANQSYSL